MMYCFTRVMRRYGFIRSTPSNQGSSRQAQIRGDIMFANTRL